MKPVVTGVLSFIVGAAASAGVLASSGNAASSDMDTIIHDYIMAHPEVIIESVEKWQAGDADRKAASAKDEIKKSHDAIFEDSKDAHYGPLDGDVTIVEFFDYNCPACKMMFKSIDELAHKDKKVHIIFKELPIFGPSSDENSRVGLAVVALAPEKYFDFHEKVMSVEGRITAEQAIAIAKGLGIDEAKLKDEMKKPYINEKINANHALSEKLGISGTPALVIGDELIPSAMNYETLKGLVDKQRKK